MRQRDLAGRDRAEVEDADGAVRAVLGRRLAAEHVDRALRWSRRARPPRRTSRTIVSAGASPASTQPLTRPQQWSSERCTSRIRSSSSKIAASAPTFAVTYPRSWASRVPDLLGRERERRFVALDREREQPLVALPVVGIVGVEQAGAGDGLELVEEMEEVDPETVLTTRPGPVQPSRREQVSGGHQRTRTPGDRRRGRRPPPDRAEGHPHPADRGPGQGGAVRRARARTGCSARSCSTSTPESGALAIEALSRGAATALLVDRDPLAVDAIRRNLRSTGLTRPGPGAAPRGRVGGPGDAADRTRPFDLVFCDPPYDQPAGKLAGVLAALAEPGWVAPEGTDRGRAGRVGRPAAAPARLGSHVVDGSTGIRSSCSSPPRRSTDRNQEHRSWPPHSARARSTR